MTLDFKEIPQANTGSGLQDTFELFARDFLAYMGYRIVDGPDRGADGKRDLIVDEVMQGVSSEYTLRWLVSCKHFAHKGKSVSDTDEINISDRLRQHGCQGFMGFYSTLPATSLSGVLKGQQWHVVFDREKIESELLKDLEGHRIAMRYFPKSFKQYLQETPTPSDVFEELLPIECEVCHKNLLLDTAHGNYLCLTKMLGDDADGLPVKDNKISDIVFVCKEHDRILSRHYLQQGYTDSWEDIDDLCNPSVWIHHLMAFMNGIFHEQDLSDKAFGKMKQMFLRTYPYVCRHLTSEEKERVRSLLQCGLMD